MFTSAHFYMIRMTFLFLQLRLVEIIKLIKEEFRFIGVGM